MCRWGFWHAQPCEHSRRRRGECARFRLAEPRQSEVHSRTTKAIGNVIRCNAHGATRTSLPRNRTGMQADHSCTRSAQFFAPRSRIPRCSAPSHTDPGDPRVSCVARCRRHHSHALPRAAVESRIPRTPRTPGTMRPNRRHPLFRGFATTLSHPNDRLSNLTRDVQFSSWITGNQRLESSHIRLFCLALVHRDDDIPST